MKKPVSILMLFIISLFFISAAGIEIKLDKTEFYQGELLQAEISGAFLDNLKLENIGIYESNKVHSVPVSSADILKLENKYLYYAVLPSAVGNYSIKIENIKYYIGQETSEETVIKNITIISTLEPYLSITPGFISTTKNFSITVKSMNAVQEITAEFKSTGQKVTKEIGFNSQKMFSFSTAEIEEYTASSIEIKDYSIPVFIYPKSAPPEPFINDTQPIEPELNNSQEPQTIPYEEATLQQIQTCEDINGKLCKKGEKCEGPTSFAEDIVCCLGECKEKSNSIAWIWGTLIFVILAAGIFWFYHFYQRKESEKTKKEILEQRAKQFQQRMNPNFPAQSEVRKSLSRT